LTTLLQSWRIARVLKESGGSNYTVRNVKEFTETKRMLYSTDPKPGRILKCNAVKLVCEFYHSDEIRRCMPGKKDFAAVKYHEERFHNKNVYFYTT
jgi:hypothetical protein